MTAPTTRYLRHLKTTCTGDPGTRLVFVCNFEVERQWAGRHVGLPSPQLPPVNAVVARMEELGVLLAGADDVLVLKRPLDPGYRDYLADAGFPLPIVVVPEHTAADRATAEDMLDSPRLLARLAALGPGGAQLLPMGTSAVEQKAAEAAGLGLAAADAPTAERVNSKIYGRRITAELGLRPVPGTCCETVGEFVAALDGHADDLAAGRPVVVKDAYGVSGRGLVVLDAPAKADRLLAMVRRRARRTGDDRLHVVVETWLPKRFDLNYQVSVDRAGRVTLDFVKRALTRDGVHRGHIMPAGLDAAHLAELERAASAVGGRLAADGFTGVAGVDAIVAADGTLYPVLEINARLNMSTYQGSVVERCVPPGSVALARHYPLRLGGPVPFEAVRRALGPLLYGATGAGPDGRLVVTCFATVNANAETGARPPFEGRLYALLVAPDPARLAALDAAAEAALTSLEVPA